MVELDLSWNKLSLVPLAQISHLKLMRRFTMRGNPLRRLDESSFSLAATARQPASQPKRPNSAIEPKNLTLLSRFVETYPNLARTLARSAHKTNGNGLILNELDGSEAEVEFAATDDPMLAELQRLAAAASPESSDDQADEITDTNEIDSDSQTSDLIGDDGSIGHHLSQLQELDFGQCQLEYIKWTSFRQLDQLKRLYLDGNQLR